MTKAKKEWMILTRILAVEMEEGAKTCKGQRSSCKEVHSALRASAGTSPADTLTLAQ